MTTLLTHCLPIFSDESRGDNKKERSVNFDSDMNQQHHYQRESSSAAGLSNKRESQRDRVHSDKKQVIQSPTTSLNQCNLFGSGRPIQSGYSGKVTCTKIVAFWERGFHM